MAKTSNHKPAKKSFFERARKKIVSLWDYFTVGVWRESRSNLRINTVKTLSLSVSSFLNTDLQTKACAMAFRTMLALVPALALIFAIGRGFGFQHILEDELFGLFPGQRDAIGESLKYVDSYLNSATEGMFVGVGLVFLLYTMISLLSSVEDTFNGIWGIKNSRSVWRQITDYTAMLLILPVLMICASGLTFFMSNTLQSVFNFPFMTPLIGIILKAASWVFIWLFFAAAYLLIPNTKVRLTNALIAGVFAGTGFMILQWLFVSGQIYVTRYNAIYGSFAFFPLLLIWLQLTWIVCLSGAVLCYSSQNIFQFSFSNEIKAISANYHRKVSVAIASVIVQAYTRGDTPPSVGDISRRYGIPVRLVGEIIDELQNAHIVNRVVIDEKRELYGFAPAMPVETLSVGKLLTLLANQGRKNFIPRFDDHFPGVDKVVDSIFDEPESPTWTCLVSQIKIKDYKTLK